MHEIDLRDEIPDDAATIEIYAMVKPAGASIEVRRDPEDDQPVLMSAGTRTTIGVPEGRKLYLSTSPLTEEFKIFIGEGFRDRIKQPRDEE